MVVVQQSRVYIRKMINHSVNQQLPKLRGSTFIAAARAHFEIKGFKVFKARYFAFLKGAGESKWAEKCKISAYTFEFSKYQGTKFVALY